ncbi:MAG: hypothetical protein ABSF80_00415 [Chitinispirillaceae bacterium]|jgi:hypothetical protein
MPINTLFVHDTVIRLVHDTIMSMNHIDIVDKIDNIYNRSYNQIFMAFFFFAGLVGIGLPLLINYYQQRNIKIREKELETRIINTEKTLKDVTNAQIKIMEMRFTITEKSIERLQERYYKLTQEDMYSNFLSDIKLNIKLMKDSPNFYMYYATLDLLLGDINSPEELYNSINCSSALRLFQDMPIDKINKISITPKDYGITYSKLIEIDNVLLKLLSKGILKESDKIKIEKVQLAISAKHKSFSVDQKGFGGIGQGIGQKQPHS